jgi:hypothetical protein
VNHLIDLPLLIQFEAENRVYGQVELAMTDAHQDQGVGLKAAMLDLHAHFGVGHFTPLVYVPDRAGPVHLEREGAVKLRVWHTDNRIADLDIVAKMQVAAFLSEAAHGPAIPQGRNIPQVVTGATIQLALVHDHLFAVQPHGARLQNTSEVEAATAAARQYQAREEYNLKFCGVFEEHVYHHVFIVGLGSGLESASAPPENGASLSNTF